jgi:hypothetical protein
MKLARDNVKVILIDYRIDTHCKSVPTMTGPA